MQGTSCRAGDQQEVGGLLAGGSGQCGQHYLYTWLCGAARVAFISKRPSMCGLHCRAVLCSVQEACHGS